MKAEVEGKVGPQTGRHAFLGQYLFKVHSIDAKEAKIS